MPAGAVALVLTSAALHAAWNLLLKRSGGTQLVVWLSKIVEALIFAPVFLFAFAPHITSWPRAIYLTSVSAIGVVANYSALSAAYRRGDMTQVYPVSRGAALVFLPVFGAVFLRERLTPFALAALACIVLGIVVVQLPALTLAAVKNMKSGDSLPAMRFAVSAAFVTALFTIWDKRAVVEVQPFAYMYLYTAIVAFTFGVWAVRRETPHARVFAWREHRTAIVLIAVLNVASYLLTLFALAKGVSSLVIGLRQLSIPIGVLLGGLFLKERVNAPRIVGSALIVAGCLVIAWR